MAGIFSARTKPVFHVDRRKPSAKLGLLHHAQDVVVNRDVAFLVRSGHGPGRPGLVEMLRPMIVKVEGLTVI